MKLSEALQQAYAEGRVIRYTDLRGRPVDVPFATKAQAERTLAYQLRLIAEGRALYTAARIADFTQG